MLEVQEKLVGEEDYTEFFKETIKTGRLFTPKKAIKQLTESCIRQIPVENTVPKEPYTSF